MKKLVMTMVLGSMLIIGACGNNKEESMNKENISNQESPSKKISEKTDDIESYKGLRIGDLVSVNYAKAFKGKYAFDFTLNKLEFTDQPLGGSEAEYESSFIIADITIKNVGKEALPLEQLENMKIGPAIFDFGVDYEFNDIDGSAKLGVGESITGKMVTDFRKLDSKLTWGLEGITTVFSYDIKADEIGDYVPE
ncbi:hypothetical protein ACWOFR_01645 [Carnobacterium gallinarum]|uniref:hypothetical protein n=1 Tax=Carnobacterium gallinarum TaxID=2749 RepID=UPI000552B5D5|nr:hypothetical protein [Carnobacterium gallinarum]